MLQMSTCGTMLTLNLTSILLSFILANDMMTQNGRNTHIHKHTHTQDDRSDYLPLKVMKKESYDKLYEKIIQIPQRMVDPQVKKHWYKDILSTSSIPHGNNTILLTYPQPLLPLAFKAILPLYCLLVNWQWHHPACKKKQKKNRKGKTGTPHLPPPTPPPHPKTPPLYTNPCSLTVQHVRLPPLPPQ